MTAGVQDLPFIMKIVAPRRRTDAVSRPRLLGALQAGLEKRVQVVWAPAGYGKTTALTELSVQAGLPVAWYTLTPEDREPTTFLTYCARAIELQIGPLGSWQRRLPGQASGEKWRSLLGRLVTALHTYLRGSMLLVFDDLHHVDSSQEIREALSLFIERAPDSLRFILAGRKRPSLSCLPRLAVQGDVNVLGVESLRFSTDETAALLCRIWLRPVAEPEARTVTGRASGWPAGIALLAKAGRTLETVASAEAPSDALLFEYLTEEVFRKLPERHQQFLLQTSILKEFTAELCDKLLDSTDSQQLLSWLVEGGYFIEERSSFVTTYRYHDLFREYLERKLKNGQPGGYLRLHRKAAALAEHRDDVGTAMEHLVAAGESMEASSLLKRVAEDRLQRGKWQTLQTWLSLLPPTAVEQDPQLLLVRAKLQLKLGEVTSAVDILDRIVSAPATDGGTQGRALVARSFASRLLGNLDAAVDNAKKGLAALAGVNAPASELAKATESLPARRGRAANFRRHGGTLSGR